MYTSRNFKTKRELKLAVDVLTMTNQQPSKPQSNQPRGMHSERRDAYRQAWREGKLTWEELQAFEEALAEEYKAR